MYIYYALIEAYNIFTLGATVEDQGRFRKSGMGTSRLEFAKEAGRKKIKLY
jgi:hypothetical protein